MPWFCNRISTALLRRSLSGCGPTMIRRIGRLFKQRSQVLYLASQPIGKSADCRVVQPQPICNLSLAVPVPMDRLTNRSIALGLGELPVQQRLEWRSAHISLSPRCASGAMAHLGGPRVGRVRKGAQYRTTQATLMRRREKGQSEFLTGVTHLAGQETQNVPLKFTRTTCVLTLGKVGQ